MLKLICIAAALIDDEDGRLFLVRKRGTSAFMQAGGKIEAGETPYQALERELAEELNFTPVEQEVRFVGTFSCPAANEPDHLLEAHLFHIRANGVGFVEAAELEDAIWIAIDDAAGQELAPLTREHVLPLARALRAGSPHSPPSRAFKACFPRS